MRFPLSYARSRMFPTATLPGTVRSFYVVNIVHANTLLAQHFPSSGPGSDFSSVAFDIEFVGRKHSDRVMQTLRVPIAQQNGHYLRLLTVAREGVVITLDLVALGALPVRIKEILGNPAIIKVGIDLKGDSILLLRHFAIAIRNGWELSHLWKCLNPSVEAAPLTSHISLDDMARIILGVQIDKAPQTSDWSIRILSVAQIKYALLDAYILVPMLRVVLQQYESRASHDFTPASFAFNADFVSDGVVIVPGYGTMGSDIRVWAAGFPAPTTSGEEWAPRHPILDQYKSSLYVDCRSVPAAAFLARELGLAVLALWKVYFFSFYRVQRWLHVRAIPSFSIPFITVTLLGLILYVSVA
ncbi:ribonuclease H-like domain-containing protein [Schizophyllum commune]